VAARPVRTSQTSDLDAFISEASLDPEFRRAFADAEARSALLRGLIGARKSQGMSQEETACFMGTTQSAVSELEGGTTDPQLSTLQRYARAVNAHVTIGLTCAASATASMDIAPTWRTADAVQRSFLAAVLAQASDGPSPEVTFEDCAA